MLHIFYNLDDKTGFWLNKSYGLDLYAETMDWAEVFSPASRLAMCFSRHARVVFVFCGGDPRGAEQGQAGEEVEERHQAKH